MLLLPNELLSHIFAYDLRKSDLSALCVVNKRVYLAALAQLYRRIPIRDPLSFHLLTRSIVFNRSLRPLVRALRISAHAGPDGVPKVTWHGGQEKSSRTLNIAGDAYEDQICKIWSDTGVERLKQLLSESTLTGPLSIFPISRSFQAIALLLVQLLAHLNSLQICHELFVPNNMSLHLDATLVGRAFPALKSFTYGKETYSNPATIHALLPIFLIPTIRSITIHRISNVSSHAPTESPPSLTPYHKSSFVEVIHLHHADLPREALVDIFNLPKHLRELHYGYSGDSNWITLDGLGQTIKCLSTTLERLAIHHTNPSEVTRIGSLHQLTSLKELVIPPHVIIGSHYSSDIDVEDLLPRNLEHISLITSSIRWNVHDYTAVLKRIITQKSRRFPKLSKAVLWVTNGAVPYMQMLEEHAVSAGVQLGIAHPHNPDQFQMIPLKGLRNDMDAYFHDSFRKRA